MFGTELRAWLSAQNGPSRGQREVLANEKRERGRGMRRGPKGRVRGTCRPKREQGMGSRTNQIGSESDKGLDRVLARPVGARRFSVNTKVYGARQVPSARVWSGLVN